MATVKVTVDVTGVEQLGERLQLLAEQVPERLQVLFMEAAGFTAAAARVLAEGSDKTLDTIKVVPTPGLSAAVQAGGGDSPLPALRERGSRGRPGPTWRHPAWGTWKVANSKNLNQKTHPYLVPAMAETRADNLDRITTGVETLSIEVIGETLPE